MTTYADIGKYLKGINPSLLVMGDDFEIASRVADAIMRHPEGKIRAVRIRQLTREGAELMYQKGEQTYPIGHTVSRDYPPVQHIIKNGHALVTYDDPAFDKATEGSSKHYLGIYWKPDKIITIEFNTDLLGDGKEAEHTLKMLARRFDRSLERETVKQVFREARRIQDRLVPKEDDVIADGYDIARIYRTARAGAGGDFMVFKNDKDGSTLLAVGDSEGKGVEAAVNAVSCASYFLFKRSGKEVDAILGGLNNYLVGSTSKTVTCAAARLDRDGTISYANAGHPTQFLVRVDSSVTELESTGMILAAVAREPYEKRKERLNPGDVLFFYTDGLSEAINSEHHQYPEDRLIGVLRDARDESSSRIVSAVWEDCKKFRGREPLLDDTLLVAAKYVG